MPGRPRRFGLTTKSFIYAVGVHAFIGALLLVSFKFSSGPVAAPPVQPATQPVQATVLTEAEVQEQLDVIAHKEEEKKREQEQAEKKLADLLAQTQKAEEQRKLEEQKLAEIKKKKEEERTRGLEEKKKQEELAQKKKEEEKKKQQELARKKEQELAKKKKEEEERKRKEAEIARKKKEEEERRKQELAEKMERERQEQMLTSALAQYTPIIRQKVSRNWNQPSGTQLGIEARVSVRLTATGEVVSAKVIRSSGNSVFDRSVENAVYKASPLPIPQDRGINERFRTLDLRFRPEDLI